MVLLRCGRWSFAPTPLLTLAALALVVLFVLLGIWQLHRARDTARLQEVWVEQGQLPLVDLNSLALVQDKPIPLGRPAQVRGRWDSRLQVLLDNQIQDGRVGYAVFTALRVDGCACDLLVNRGWVGAPEERSQIPQVQIGSHAVAVKGVLAAPPSGGLGGRGGLEQLPIPGFYRAQQLDLATMPTTQGVRRLPFVLLLDPAAPDGFARRWQRHELRAERHTAYAFQWFTFALITAGLYLGLNLRRRPPRV